jgi:hypothetical protein
MQKSSGQLCSFIYKVCDSGSNTAEPLNRELRTANEYPTTKFRLNRLHADGSKL